MTDDEAITLAMLHGCEFHQTSVKKWWYPSTHPGENHREWWDSRHVNGHYLMGHFTREELAHHYCKVYKLELTPCLPETSSLPPSS